MIKGKPVVDVSIIIPNYNYGKYLSVCLDSIIESSVSPFQIIVVDDGSDDNSRAVLEKYKKWPFMQVIFFDSNLGLTTALNTALDHASGKYIMRMDADDIMHPERIKKQYDYLESHPEVDILGSNVLYFKKDLNHIVNRSNFPSQHENIINTYSKGEHGIQHPTVCIRGDVYRQFRYQKEFPGEDYELMSRMVISGYTFANLKEPLHYMRIHTGSSTSNLKLSGIRRTFVFRDKLFKTKTSSLRIYTYFLYIKFYRKFQIEDHWFWKLFYGILSSIFAPGKLYKKLSQSLMQSR